MLLPSFLERFVTTFTAEPFRQLARLTGWWKRKGKIDPFEFFISLTFGEMSTARQTLSSQSQSLPEPVSRQAIDQRYTPAAVDYFKAAFAHVLAQTLDWSPAHPQAESLRTHFTALYLLDSTSFDCPASLKDIFPSCGGDASPANVKVLLRYDLITGTLEPLHVLAGKRSDQGQAFRAAELLLEGQLQLQDKGFFDSKAWLAAQARRAYLLMPLPHSSKLWLTTGISGEEVSLDLAAALKASTQNLLEWPNLMLGTEGHRVQELRLAAFRLSEESASRQRAGLREMMRKQGRVPSAKALELAGWLLLLTNAPVAKLPTKMMSYMYRMRWQVELIFRQMKTVVRVDQPRSGDPHRIQTEIWARLICAVLLFLWHAHASAECWRRYQCEASFEKISLILQQWGHTIARAFSGHSSKLLEKLREVWAQILRNGRKGTQKTRRNSWQNLFELWLSGSSTAV